MVLKLFFSYKFTIFLLFILAVGAAVATFLENFYDTQTAKILVYNAFWYETIMFFLLICLICVSIKAKIWKKFGAFFIHLSFIVIILGAFLTRYFGEEGVLHLRENIEQNEMISTKAFLQIKNSNGENFDFETKLSQIGNNDFLFTKIIDDKEIFIKFLSYNPTKKGEKQILSISVNYKDQKPKILTLKGGVGWIGDDEIYEDILISWGSKTTRLPFFIKLKNFDLQRYPGSNSPSSYVSNVEVIDKDTRSNFAIFLNNPLNYQGYKFFQSSYDSDLKGTILEINKDPGKIPTYIGYFLLCLGFISNFFTKNSRFTKLRKFIKNSQILSIFILLFFINLNADELENLRQNSKNHIKNLSEILVQDYLGRIKPFHTEALEIVEKFSSSNSLFGLNPQQIILGMNINPNLWRNLKIIKIKNPQIKQILNIEKKQNFVSFNEIFDENGDYKLFKYIELANQKPSSKRNIFEKDIIKFDERINIVYLVFKGEFFRFIPILDDENQKWLSPNKVYENNKIHFEVKDDLSEYIFALQQGIFDNQNTWELADLKLEKLKSYQQKSQIIPSKLKIKAEIFYNQISIFKNLSYFYIIFGLFYLSYIFYTIFTDKIFLKFEKISYKIFCFSFLIYTFGLFLRWYISSHAPWSDSYESMIYIGWSAILAGVIFKDIFGLSSILASIFIFVANFGSSQITNLVPVLKSYWLSIHVSVITASYGFLGFGFLIGIFVLILMILKNQKNQTKLNFKIRKLIAIDELSLIFGISLLTMGNFFGGVWANESWGRYWGWDSKETWSFVSILVYAIVLHLRFILNSVFIFAVASVFAYFSIIMTYFGVNFYLTGMHSYAATGEIPQIPKFLYLILIFLILLCVFAYKGRDVKNI